MPLNRLRHRAFGMQSQVTIADRLSGVTYVMATVLLMALILAVHLAPTGAGDPYLRGAIYDVAHVLGFAAIAVLLVTAYRHKARALGIPERIGVAVSLAVVLIMAIASEAAQYLTARNADLTDLGRDLCGIAVGLAFTVAFRLRLAYRFAIFLLAVTCLLTTVQHPVGTLIARATVWLDPITAFGFERGFEKRLVASGTADLEVVSPPKHWPAGGHVLRVTPSGKADLEGMSHHGMPRDWSAYGRLRFTIAAEHPQLRTLILMIHGPKTAQSRQARFRWQFLVDTEPREIVVFLNEIVGPTFRPLHLKNIESVNILAENSARLSFYVDDVRLD